MPAGCRSTHEAGARGPAGRPRRTRGFLVALLAGLCGFALPVAPAFGEGSVNINTGPGTALRQGLNRINDMLVYAQPGELIQMGSSAMGLGGTANMQVFAPDGSLALDCATSAPGTGRINSRAQELAGPLPNAGGYTPCQLAATASGVYRVHVTAFDTASVTGNADTVDVPRTDIGQGLAISMWDITVRTGGVVAPGRVFSNLVSNWMDAAGAAVSNYHAYVYTKSGYEYDLTLFDHRGVGWGLAADDKGVVDATTGERKFASFRWGDPASNTRLYNDATYLQGIRYPIFFNPVDPLVVSGPGGLAATRGFSSTPIAPSSNPLANQTFTGSGGQSGGTNQGSGGTIGFTSPQAMEGLGYTVLIDTNRDGVFGNASDFVNAKSNLESDGTNAFAWSGRDAAGNVPGCGDYPYQIRSTLSEVHVTMDDVENSGGTRLERLSLPADSTLGNPLALSYNDIDPYKTPPIAATNTSPVAVTNGTSGPGFHSWSGNSGNTAYVDTWTRLPEVAASGTLRLLCADPQIVKSVSPSPVVPGTNATYSLKVTNHGPDTATNVRVVDPLPTKLSFVSASSGCAEVNNTVTCTWASLASGASHTFTVTAKVASSAKGCADLRNTATVSNDVVDTDLSNNSSTVCQVELRSNLSITKVPSRTTVPTDGQVMYTLVVKNNGPSDDSGVKVTDPMAQGLSLVSAKPSQGSCSTASGQVSCSLGDLEAGGSAQVLVTARVTAGSGCITNTSTVVGDNRDTNGNDNEGSAKICVEPGPEPKFDLVVAKTANHKSVYVGQPVKYTVTVSNKGPAAAPNAKVTDTLNHPASVVSVKSTQGSCTKKIPMTCQLGNVPAGGKVTITVTVKLRDNGCKQRNAASATGEGTDSNPANNLARVDVCAKAVPLRLTKVADKSVVRGGGLVGYTIRVSNPTVGEAKDVEVCDRLPSGLVYVSSKATAKLTKGQYCWHIETLGAHKSRSYRIVLRALGSASGDRVNHAAASAPGAKTRRAKDQVHVLPFRAVDPVTG
jgi:uncharacterized repeat protein (TIGR01451 family)